MVLTKNCNHEGSTLSWCGNCGFSWAPGKKETVTQASTNVKVYIAGSFNDKDRIKPYRDQLRNLGFKVRSSWLDTPQINSFVGMTEAVKRQEAQRDFNEIDEADFVIVDTTTPSSSGGYEIETGYALGLGKRFMLVGPAHNVFHTLAGKQFVTWEECLAHLSDHAHRR